MEKLRKQNRRLSDIIVLIVVLVSVVLIVVNTAVNLIG
jgi:hypothetical protein